MSRVRVHVVRCLAPWLALVGRPQLMLIMWCAARAALQATHASTRSLMMVLMFVKVLVKTYHIIEVMQAKYAPGCPGASWISKAPGIYAGGVFTVLALLLFKLAGR